METLKYLGLAALLVVAGGSCARGFPSKLPGMAPGDGGGAELAGILRTTTGESIDLSAPQTEPVVVVFAQDTCSVCRAETQEFRSSLRDPSRAPGRVKLITVLVGAIEQDAVDWKADNQVPWSVALQPGDALFRSLCQEGKVPCTVVHLPRRGLVFRHTGAARSSEITELTGNWESGE